MGQRDANIAGAAPGGAGLLLVLLAPLAASADSLSDLRAVLKRFPAKAPFSVEASVQAKGRSQEGAASRAGSAAFVIDSGPEGLTIRVPQSQLAVATTEAAAKKIDPDAPTPTRTAMVALSIFDVINALDAGAMLLDDLDNAALISQSSAQRDGKPATLLRIKVKPALAGTRSKFVNAPEIELRLWLGPDGVPIAAERDSKYSASIAIATAANVRTEKWDFAVAKDRLYASRNEQEDRASAAGKAIVSSRSLRYVPNP